MHSAKTLLNCLAQAFPMAKPELTELMEGIGIAPSRRGETLSIEEFAKLADALTK